MQKNFFFGHYRDDCLVCDLNFIMEIGQDHSCYLDLKVSASVNKLMTTVYSKTTESHFYLYSTSCHKSSSINGIQNIAALRLRGICSTTEEYQSKAKRIFIVFSCKRT